MKPFNLEEALAGKPVRLRDGRKAHVKYEIHEKYSGGSLYLISGYIVNKTGKKAEAVSWTKRGKFYDLANCFDNYDILGMWEEPKQPRIKVDLPAPLKEPREGMFYIEFGTIYQSKWKENEMIDNEQEAILTRGGYYATAEDAQEWLNAMKNNRA
ncbi:pyruvate kinase [Mannheimia haemolytica]